jgi:hypothetical protein
MLSVITPLMSKARPPASQPTHEVFRLTGQEALTYELEGAGLASGFWGSWCGREFRANGRIVIVGASLAGLRAAEARFLLLGTAWLGQHTSIVTPPGPVSPGAIWPCFTWGRRRLRRR